MVIFLKNPKNGKIKKGILGFSFTTFFFGAFVPLFRGDFKMFFPIFLLYAVGLYFMPYTYTNIDGFYSFQIDNSFWLYNAFSSAYYFLINICGAFFYNKIYTQGLVKKGYIPMSEESRAILYSKGIKLPEEYMD